MVVLQHGLFGSPLDMRFVEEELLRCTERERVVVLNTGECTTFCRAPFPARSTPAPQDA